MGPGRRSPERHSRPHSVISDIGFGCVSLLLEIQESNRRHVTRGFDAEPEFGHFVQSHLVLVKPDGNIFGETRD